MKIHIRAGRVPTDTLWGGDGGKKVPPRMGRGGDGGWGRDNGAGVGDKIPAPLPSLSTKYNAEKKQAELPTSGLFWRAGRPRPPLVPYSSVLDHFMC